MHKRLTHLSLCFGFIILLTGCDKPIHGKLTDNFGMPLRDAEIKIKDSDFKARTDSDGEFSVDYAPGKIEITFSKDGHVSDKRNLEITQKADYPLSTIELIRLPGGPGIFIKDSLDYVQLSTKKMTQSSRRQRTMFGTLTVSNYYLPTDSIFKVEIKKDILSVFQYKIGPIYLMSPNSNGVLATEDDISSFVPQQWIDDDPQKITDDLLIRTIRKTSNKKYAYATGVKKSILGFPSLRNVNRNVYAFEW